MHELHVILRLLKVLLLMLMMDDKIFEILFNGALISFRDMEDND
jgi:hypothetical protein